MNRWTAVVALGLLASAPTSALGGVFDLYGYGGRSAGMGNAVVADATDHTAAFYNPAALVRGDRVHVGGGLLVSMPSLDIHRAPSSSDEIETAVPSGFSGFLLGAQVPFGPLVAPAGSDGVGAPPAGHGRRFALGFGAYLPSNNIFRAEGLDANRPQFYMYQSLPDKLTLLAAGAWQPLPGLSFGAGVQILVNIRGDIRLDADLANGRFERRDVLIELVPSAAPTAGVLWARSDGRLRVGASWRGALSLDYRVPARLDLGEAVRLDLLIEGVAHYTPHQLTFGAAWEPGSGGPAAAGGWTLTAEVTRALWSQAPDPSPRMSIDMGGTLLDGLGLGRGLDVAPGGAPRDLRFEDILIPRIGVEHRPNDALAVRAGWFYRPSVVPYQDGASNYVDSAAHGLSVGAATTFSDPLEAHDHPITLEASVLWIQHTEVSVKKADPADPVGPYTADGSVMAFQLGFRHDY